MISICIKDNNYNIQNFIFNKLNNSNISNIYYSKNNFKFYKNVIIHYKGKDFSKFYNYISDILAEIVIKFYEKKIIKRFLNNEYFYFDTFDRNQIYNDYISTNSKIKYKSLNKDFKKYIMKNKNIILDGFVNFRLNNYYNFLNDSLTTTISNFVLNKEYLEFVSLLKSYVNSKIPNPCTINLVYVNKEAILLDENSNIIELEPFSSTYLSDISFSKNDFVLNTLIGKLPQKIKVHLISKKDEFINTLELIFNTKINYCNNCELCNAYKLLNLK